MSDHNCPGLARCIAHWKWRTVQLVSGGARVIPPGFWSETFYQRQEFPSHAEAIAYATTQARAGKVVAVQDGAL